MKTALRMHDVKDVMVVAAGATKGESQVLKSALQLANVEDFFIANDLQDYMALTADKEPDAVIAGLTISGKPSVEIIRRIRAGESGINRFTPVIIAMSNPEAVWVKRVLAAGSHEVVGLPVSPADLAARLHRAVFIGRPFVSDATYFGPCRRRRCVNLNDRPERRLAPWQGYVHAAHKTKIPQPEVLDTNSFMLD